MIIYSQIISIFLLWNFVLHTSGISISSGPSSPIPARPGIIGCIMLANRALGSDGLRWSYMSKKKDEMVNNNKRLFPHIQCVIIMKSCVSWNHITWFVIDLDNSSSIRYFWCCIYFRNTFSCMPCTAIGPPNKVWIVSTISLGWTAILPNGSSTSFADVYAIHKCRQRCTVSGWS